MGWILFGRFNTKRRLILNLFLLSWSTCHLDLSGRSSFNQWTSTSEVQPDCRRESVNKYYSSRSMRKYPPKITRSKETQWHHEIPVYYKAEMWYQLPVDYESILTLNPNDFGNSAIEHSWYRGIKCRLMCCGMTGNDLMHHEFTFMSWMSWFSSIGGSYSLKYLAITFNGWLLYLIVLGTYYFFLQCNYSFWWVGLQT